MSNDLTTTLKQPWGCRQGASDQASRAASRRLLWGFSVSFATALATGFYYYLVPRDGHWAVAQAALILHIASGALSLALFIPFVLGHQRQEEGRSLFLVAPWLARRQPEPQPWRSRQRLLGYALNGSAAVLFLSGLLLIVPGLLFLLDIIWLPGYLSYQIGNAVHLVATVSVSGLIALHLKRRREDNRDGREEQR